MSAKIVKYKHSKAGYKHQNWRTKCQAKMGKARAKLGTSIKMGDQMRDFSQTMSCWMNIRLISGPFSHRFS